LRLNGMMGWQDVLDLLKTAMNLVNNTHDEAQGKPLPSLIDFGAEVAAILCIHSVVCTVIAVIPQHT
jgi:hypothetical protein